MYGNNPIRKADHDPNKLSVQEVFYTLQGEGPQSGRPAVFVRLAGCNLACFFCDTEFESNINQVLSPASVVERVFDAPSTSRRCDLVVLTGGEPLRQNCFELLRLLQKAGVKLVQIETAGTLWQDWLQYFIDVEFVQLVCSPKTPLVHPKIEVNCRHWKYVVAGNNADPYDGLPMYGMQPGTLGKKQKVFRADLGPHSDDTIWVSPMDLPEEREANTKFAAQLCLDYGYRLSLQTHKLVGLP